MSIFYCGHCNTRHDDESFEGSECQKWFRGEEGGCEVFEENTESYSDDDYLDAYVPSCSDDV
jgi:hypothetical protein